MHAGDQQMDGFDQWAFMTTHNWDEPSAGVWRLEVRNGFGPCEYLCIPTTTTSTPVFPGQPG